MSRYSLYLSSVALLACLTSPLASQQTGSFVDPRSSDSYRWVRIGYQVWMAEDLRFPGGIYYDLAQYGRVYTWEAARQLCPSGWHLPSDPEWQQLERAAGMADSELASEGQRNSGEVGRTLKAQRGWRTSLFGTDGNGGDVYGFAALPGGFYQGYDHRFLWWGSHVMFWTSTEVDSENAISRELDSDYAGVQRGSSYKVHGAYVRCIADAG